MKMYFFVILSFLFLSSVTINAQYNFVVQNGTAEVFKTIDEAYTNAINGDTIYLPGGSFNMPVISKSLVWIGMGYHPDSTAATYFTRINNQVSLLGTADNSYFTGMHFISSFVMGSNSNPAENVTIFRCRIGGNLSLKYNDSQAVDVNATVSETIIDGVINGYEGGNSRFEKCIIGGTVTSVRNSLFDRIVNFKGSYSGAGYSYFFSDVQGCLVTNSVFPIATYTPWFVDIYNNLNNTFNNNIFQGATTFPAGTNTGSGNLTGVDLNTVFENIDGLLSVFSYQHDFHMKAGSPGIGTGTLGTDISIYSGTSPFKEGGLPITPNINKVIISPETENGLLRVEIGVRAQDK
jgi:hypothetical protein